MQQTYSNLNTQVREFVWNHKARHGALFLNSMLQNRPEIIETIGLIGIEIQSLL